MFRLHGDAHLSLVTNGMHGIHDQVSHGLFNLGGVDGGYRSDITWLERQGDALFAREGSQQLDSAPRQVIDVGRFALWPTPSCKIEKLPNCGRYPFALLDDPCGVLTALFDGGVRLGNQPSPTDYHAERSANLVGNSRGNLPDQSQSIAVAELFDGGNSGGGFSL